MEKTINFEITESQVKRFEDVIDATLKILNRIEKESPEREARFDKNHEDFMEKVAEMQKKSERTSSYLAKWEISSNK